MRTRQSPGDYTFRRAPRAHAQTVRPSHGQWEDEAPWVGAVTIHPPMESGRPARMSEARTPKADKCVQPRASVQAPTVLAPPIPKGGHSRAPPWDAGKLVGESDLGTEPPQCEMKSGRGHRMRGLIPSSPDVPQGSLGAAGAFLRPSPQCPATKSTPDIENHRVLVKQKKRNKTSSKNIIDQTEKNKTGRYRRCSDTCAVYFSHRKTTQN